MFRFWFDPLPPTRLPHHTKIDYINEPNLFTPITLSLIHNLNQLDHAMMDPTMLALLLARSLAYALGSTSPTPDTNMATLTLVESTRPYPGNPAMTELDV